MSCIFFWKDRYCVESRGYTELLQHNHIKICNLTENLDLQSVPLAWDGLAMHNNKWMLFSPPPSPSGHWSSLEEDYTVLRQMKGWMAHHTFSSLRVKQLRHRSINLGTKTWNSVLRVEMSLLEQHQLYMGFWRLLHFGVRFQPEPLMSALFCLGISEQEWWWESTRPSSSASHAAGVFQFSIHDFFCFLNNQICNFLKKSS